LNIDGSRRQISVLDPRYNLEWRIGARGSLQRVSIYGSRGQQLWDQYDTKILTGGELSNELTGGRFNMKSFNEITPEQWRAMTAKHRSELYAYWNNRGKASFAVS
jgi:hypothetical protein